MVSAVRGNTGASEPERPGEETCSVRERVLHRRLIVLAWLVPVLAASATGSAAAAVRAGSVEDPADMPGESDIAAATVSYDDAGTLELRLRFHEPIEQRTPGNAEWAITAAKSDGGCGDTRQSAAGVLALRSGDGTLTYAEVSDEGVPFEVEVPVRQTLSADRREFVARAESASLSRRAFACSQVALSNGDEAPEIVLAVVAPGPGAGAPGGSTEDGGPEGSTGPVGGLRMSGVRLSYKRRGRLVRGTLRARVCAPAGRRIEAEIRERRRRIGRRAFSPAVLHTYARRQRVRCQLHRWSWRFRSSPAARYTVRVRLRVRAVELP